MDATDGIVRSRVRTFGRIWSNGQECRLQTILMALVITNQLSDLKRNDEWFQIVRTNAPMSGGRGFMQYSIRTKSAAQQKRSNYGIRYHRYRTIRRCSTAEQYSYAEVVNPWYDFSGPGNQFEWGHRFLNAFQCTKKKFSWNKSYTITAHKKPRITPNNLGNVELNLKNGTNTILKEMSL